MEPENAKTLKAGELRDLATIALLEEEEGTFSTYANVINMDWTLYDVRFRFAELMQVPDDELPTWENQRAVVLEKALIRIPWHQAKMLRDLLDGVVKSYESLNGELKQPLLALDPNA